MARRFNAAERAHECFSTDGDRLYSYRTCLAERAEDGAWLVNVTDYSRTTSFYQGQLMAWTTAQPHGVRVYRGVPPEERSMRQYEQRCAREAARGMLDVERERARRGDLALHVVADRQTAMQATPEPFACRG